MPTGPSPSLRWVSGRLASLVFGALLAGSAPLAAVEAPAPTPGPVAAAPRDLGEAFQKGPIGLSARVFRKGAEGGEQGLPLFQVPVLRYQDRLEISLSGEAFDPRVTQSEWSLIVVFLPRTVAPTERGVVELRLRRRGTEMVAAPFTAPYDAIPMFFLVPDTGGRRKILADLSSHLGAFRAICLKLSDLAEERAHADRFLAGLESIRKDQSAPAYDAAVFNFLKSYGGQVSQDFRVFLGSHDASNLDKVQFLTQEFRRTNILVPTGEAADRGASLQAQTVSGPVRPASAYVSIVFDLVQIFQNLWPGHQFQYAPALARDFDGARAQLWYGDWIHTTGDVRGAIVFCPGRWEDAEVPDFTFDLPAEGSLLQSFGQVLIHPRAKGNLPFALFGHDWQMVLEGPRGERPGPLPLVPSPAKQAFAIQPGPALESLKRAGLRSVKARIQGRWGFQPVVTEASDLPAGLDPAWRPTVPERAHFMVGETGTFRLPAPWAACVGRVAFRPAGGGSPALEARLEPQPDGSRLAAFGALQGAPGPGFLDLHLPGEDRPALSLPMALLPPLPVVDHVEAHQGERTVLVAGRHLGQANACLLGGRVLARSRENGDGWLFESGEPLPGEAGVLLQGELRMADGRTLPLREVRMLPPRPQLGPLQVIPERPAEGLPLHADQPLIPPATPVVLSILPARRGPHPFGRAPKVLLRSADDPAAVQTVPPKSVRLIGRGQRLLVAFRGSELLGPSASGRLEVQVSDAAAGASAWVALQPLFIDLPTVTRLQRDAAGARLEGPSLEAIEAVATDSRGPWVPFAFGFEDGRETGAVPAPGPSGALFLRLYGWPDLAVRLDGPVPAQEKVTPGPAGVPGPQPPKPPTAPAPPRPPDLPKS